MLRPANAGLAVLVLLGVASAKVIDGTVKLSAQDTEKYLAKFSFSAFETAHIKGEFHVENGLYFDQHQHALVLCLYDEAQWAKFQTALKKGSLCQEREALASWKTDRIHPTMNYDKALRDFAFESHLTAPKGSAHYWFAVLMDCYLEEYDAHPPPMRYHITMTNGKSHLPADESGMRTINLLTLLAMGGYGVWCAFSAIAHMKRSGQVHLIALIFYAAYALQVVSVACELMHLNRYAKDGKGLRFRHTVFALDFVSGLAQTLSELILSVLLIALAFGWTLGLESQEPLEGLTGRVLGGLHRPALLLRGLKSPSAMLLLGIGGSQVFLHTLSHGYDEDFNNFHDFEHWPGMLLILIRLALCGVFMWALRRSVALERQSEVVAFLKKLYFAGTVWFLCLPVLVVLALVLPPYRRHQLVAGGSILGQFVALALLSTLFFESSQYYKASSLKHMGQELPQSLGGAFGGGSRAGLGGKIAVD